jgi:hypothetical protein
VVHQEAAHADGSLNAHMLAKDPIKEEDAACTYTRGNGHVLVLERVVRGDSREAGGYTVRQSAGV